MNENAFNMTNMALIMIFAMITMIDVINTMDCEDIVIRKPARFGKRSIYFDDNLNMIDNNNGKNDAMHTTKRETIYSHPCLRLERRSSSSLSSPSNVMDNIDNIVRYDINNNNENMKNIIDYDHQTSIKNNNRHYEYDMINNNNNNNNNIDNKYNHHPSQPSLTMMKMNQQNTNQQSQELKIKLPKNVHFLMKISSILFGGYGNGVGDDGRNNNEDVYDNVDDNKNRNI